MASLADFEHKPKPKIDTSKARANVAKLDKTIASLAQLLPRMDEGGPMYMDEAGQIGGGYDPAGITEKSVGWLMPTGTLAEAAQGARNLGGTVKSMGSVIKDWRWRPEAEVLAELGLSEIPPHVQDFGRFMEDMAQKAKQGDMSARDLIKAYTITRSSIQRQAQSLSKLRERWPDYPGDGLKARPEGAFSEWLFTPAGQQYLNMAEKGHADLPSIQDAVDKLGGFGKGNDLIAALAAGADLPGQEKSIAELISLAHSKPGSVNDDWRAWTKELSGIGPAKTGFIGSLLGKGDMPTLDARQILLHTGRPTSEAVPYLSRKSGLGGQQAVDKLAGRQKRMDLELPDELRPFYQHLAHHAVWDKYGNETTTHDDLMRAMRLASNPYGLNYGSLADYLGEE